MLLLKSIVNKSINKIKTKEFWVNLIQETIVDIIIIIVGTIIGLFIKSLII